MEKQFSQIVKVVGNRNLYSWQWISHCYLPPRKQAQVRKSLAEWQELWGTKETESLEAQAKLKNYDRALKTGGPALDDFRLLAGSPGTAAGKDGKDLGADVDVVAAYERWKQTPAYQHWLKDSGQLLRRDGGGS